MQPLGPVYGCLWAFHRAIALRGRIHEESRDQSSMATTVATPESQMTTLLHSRGFFRSGVK